MIIGTDCLIKPLFHYKDLKEEVSGTTRNSNIFQRTKAKEVPTSAPLGKNIELIFL